MGENESRGAWKKCPILQEQESFGLQSVLSVQYTVAKVDNEANAKQKR